MTGFYTINVLYKGGNYTSQVNGVTIKEAIINWAEMKNFGSFNVDYDKFYPIILHIVNEQNKIIKLEHLVNVWCICFNLDNENGVINIVKTVQ